MTLPVVLARAVGMCEVSCRNARVSARAVWIFAPGPAWILNWRLHQPRLPAGWKGGFDPGQGGAADERALRAQARSAAPLGTPTPRAASRSVAALCSKARHSSSDMLGSSSFMAPCRPDHARQRDRHA